MTRSKPRALLFVSAALLLAMCAWWSILLHRLAVESYDQSVHIWGADSAEARRLAPRSSMIAWESVTLFGTTLVLLGLGFRASRRESRHAEQMRVLFAASTHELKTPIAGLRALLESLQNGVLPPASAGPHLAAGIEATDRLEGLVESMLVRQAVLTGESPRETRTLDAWLQPVLARRALRPDFQLSVDAPPAALAARLALPGDALRVILDNLLDNALKYAGVGPVRLVATLYETTLQLDVIDSGAGFDPADAARLFEPWNRGRHIGTPSGTGLGLYLARAIALEAGGELSADSAGPGRGATFSLRLPTQGS